jgi:SAM-dependent methyltransferase
MSNDATQADAAGAPAFHQLAESEIVELKDYIIHREAMLDRDLLPYGDPKGKDVLVFGCGYGNEVLWAARRGARSVLATDLSAGLSPVPFQRAMAECGIQFFEYEFRRQNIHDTALTGERFDLIVANGVFEHVHDLKGVLAAFRPLLRPGGRAAIFADGLWYSSIGGHIAKGPWEHLWRDPRELKSELTELRWEVLCNQLNRMTASDFLDAIRSAGLLVLQFKLGRDPNFAQIPHILPKIRNRADMSPTDLSIVSIGCELCFPEHI